MKITQNARQNRNKRGHLRNPVALTSLAVASSGERCRAIIRDLSSDGLLLETGTRIGPGERIDIDIPEIGIKTAKVIWSHEDHYGCLLEETLTSADVSAVRLRSGFIADSSKNEDAYWPSPLLGEIETLGDRLRRIRTSHRMSVVDLARLLGVSRPTVWYWENNKSVPRPAKLKAFSQLFGVPECYLQKQTGSNKSTNKISETRKDHLELESVLDRARTMIANAAGVSPKFVRITIDF